MKFFKKTNQYRYQTTGNLKLIKMAYFVFQNIPFSIDGTKWKMKFFSKYIILAVKAYNMAKEQTFENNSNFL